jgi:hypothetical protein
MSTTLLVESDERTVAVENASYRWGWFLLYLGVLYDGCYRLYVRHEAVWDLLALAIGSAVFCALYQARQKALTQGRFKTMLRIALVFGVLGAVWGSIVAWQLDKQGGELFFLKGETP